MIAFRKYRRFDPDLVCSLTSIFSEGYHIWGLKIKCDYPISKLNVAFNRIKHLSWYYYFDREWNSLQGCDLDLFPLNFFLHCSSFIDSCKVYLMMILKYMIMVKISACIGSKNSGGSLVITLLLYSFLKSI